MEREYQICTRCVMDTSDPEITFDENGICNHCIQFDEETKSNWFPNSEGAKKLDAILDRIKEEGKDQEYDCIMGLSGGVDSSYLALKVYEWGLRPLVMHVDAGWNSELAVANIETIVKYCNYDLHTHVVDWEDMRALQLSLLRAAVANQDVPQDHIFFSSLYHYAIKNGIRFIINGGNIATESIFPQAWHGSAMDSINLRAIHKRYGTEKLKSYKTISFFKLYFWYPIIRRLRTLRPLDYMEYNREGAIVELEKIGWRSYGLKHGESIFTKFFQNYYLPTKFGYDKRRPHFSSMIASGQMSREEALEQLKLSLYESNELETDILYFCKKLQINRSEFMEFLTLPAHHYSEFPNWDKRYQSIKKVQRVISHITGKRLNIYS